MPAPVIQEDSSLHAYRVGEFFVIELAASNTPTGWTADNLPEGVTIHATTGKISGAAEEPGFFNVKVNASNNGGVDVSADYYFPMGIRATNLALDGSTELDFDLATSEVTNPAINETGKNELPVVLYAKKGDSMLLSIGFKKGKWLNQLPIASVNVAIKEFESETRLVFTDGLFEQFGAYDTARFQILLNLDRDALAPVLGNYEDDKNTYFDAIAEIRFGMLWTRTGDPLPTVLERSSSNFIIRIARDLAPDIVDEEEE